MAAATKRVTGRVTKLVVDREKVTEGGSTVYKIKASWVIPDQMSDVDAADHAEFIDAECDITKVGASNTEGEVWGTPQTATDKPLSYTGYDKNWLKGLSMATSFEKPYARNRYYPLKNDPSYACEKVYVSVHGGNGSGVGGTDPSDRRAYGRGPLTEATYRFYKPHKPTVTIDYDASSAEAEVTVETEHPDDGYECYDTRFRWYLRRQDGSEVVLQDWYTTTSESYTNVNPVDLSSYLVGLTAGKYVRLTVEAYARGMAGDSAVTTASRTVGMPAAATVKSVAVDKKAAGGIVQVSMSTSELAQEVKLQRRHGADGEWEDVDGAVDDANCRMLYDTYAAAEPVAGEYIYYRVVSSRDGYTVEGAPMRADCLYTAKPKNTCTSTVGVVSTSSGTNGTVALVTVGFTDSETYTGTMGTEVSWSDYRYAWNSTEGPQTYVVSGSGSASSGEFSRTVGINITGLTSGKTYYVRARRVREVDGETIYSKYSPVASFATESAQDDEVFIDSVSCEYQGTGRANGKRATVTVVFNEDNLNTGTEITWADHKDAWQSNEPPESLLATWARSAAPSGSDFQYKQVTYIRGLAPGTTYWIKARRYKESDSGTTYSPWSKLGSFTTPTAEEDVNVMCGLPSAKMDEDGRGIVAVVGWGGQRTGNELSWSDDENAWSSSKQPSSMMLDWEDEENGSYYFVASTDTSVVSGKTYYTRSASAPYTYTKVASPSGNPSTKGYYERKRWWSHTSTAYIRDLDPGTTYYVRARSYYDGGSERVWSDWSRTVAVTPYSAPDSVSLDAPSAVARGKGIECWWSVTGDLDQKKWRIVADGASAKDLRSGSGSLCRTVVPADRYGNASSITFHVESSCGGAYTQSNSVTVGIANKPTCSVSVTATATAQPVSFTVTTNNKAAKLLCTCKSRGITQQLPDGSRDQIAGDTVWTAAVEPSWTGSGGSYTATVAIPEHTDFVDGGRYTVTVKAVEPVAGLASAAASATFRVVWSHQAITPPKRGITVTPDVGTRSVTITTTAPSGAAGTDVYDIYRKNPTGYDLIASDLPMSSEVVDRFAPFGKDADLKYRVCFRTADGDLKFRDFAYSMPVNILRFDWDGGSVELPYNLKTTEGWAKSFEGRQHVDGSVNGYWEKSVDMTGSYSTDVIRLGDLSQYELLCRLGEHPGAVFCRTNNGMAFQCNAEPRDLSTSFGTARLAASVAVTRVALTDQFRAKSGREVSNG